MKSAIRPARALAYRPLRSRASQTSSGVSTWTSRNAPAGSINRLAASRPEANGAIGAATASPPWVATSDAT